jgi:hypothetical protein
MSSSKPATAPAASASRGRIDISLAEEDSSLTAALRQQSHGKVAEPAEQLPETPGGADLDQEVVYLVRVTQAYASSPIVRAYRARLPCRPGAEPAPA